MGASPLCRDRVFGKMINFQNQDVRFPHRQARTISGAADYDHANAG